MTRTTSGGVIDPNPRLDGCVDDCLTPVGGDHSAECAIIPCGWCDFPVPVDVDEGQVVYCSDDHRLMGVYHEGKDR